MFDWGKFGYKIKRMGNSVQSFKEFYETSFLKESPENANRLASEFFRNFILSVPRKIDLLESYVKSGRISDFYNQLNDFKYLIEYSDDLSRYWYFMRGYSGALAKLKADKTVKGAKKLYVYYFEKYGDRRTIKDEHWFEKKRWEFLDELQTIYSDYELDLFIEKYTFQLIENFEIYCSFLRTFVNDLKRYQAHHRK